MISIKIFCQRSRNKKFFKHIFLIDCMSIFNRIVFFPVLDLFKCFFYIENIKTIKFCSTNDRNTTCLGETIKQKET